MKRPGAVAIAVAFFGVVLLAQVSQSTALVTPLITPAATLDRFG